MEEPETYFPDVSVDFAALNAKSPELVGWIWTPETSISFPLLRAGDNSKCPNLSYDLHFERKEPTFHDAHLSRR